jgi:hypothetical protein
LAVKSTIRLFCNAYISCVKRSRIRIRYAELDKITNSIFYELFIMHQYLCLCWYIMNNLLFNMHGMNIKEMYILYLLNFSVSMLHTKSTCNNLISNLIWYNYIFWITPTSILNKILSNQTIKFGVKKKMTRLWWYSKGTGKVHPITGHEGPEVEYKYRSTLSLTLALDRGEWSTPRPGRFAPDLEPGTHCVGSWVGSRAGLDGCGKSRLHWNSIPGPYSP